MKYGFVLPKGDARTAANLAVELEQAGWDGLFVWEPVYGIDAWVSLAAAAMVTTRIRLGTMITPISRMRPWDLAGKAATLDNLSGGRVILSIGLGAPDTGWASFGEVTDRKMRAELMDEGLDIMTGLWRDPTFTYAGKHYTLAKNTFFVPPPPVQQPRIPIWLVGALGFDKSMNRAFKYDGILPNKKVPGLEIARVTPADIRSLPMLAATMRGGTTWDIVVEGHTPGDDPSAARATVQAFADAGATWFIEALWDSMDDPHGVEAVFTRARQGPPR